MHRCVVVWLGQTPYLPAWELQKRLGQQVAEGRLPNVLLLLEHPHVYTLGRRGRESDILLAPEALAELGVEVHWTDRGGEVTYHGPGQLVGYPIINLRAWGGGPVKYVATLEKMLIATLARLGVRGESDGRPTGVWVGEAKVAAIGVKISRGVTSHGFALNVCPDLSYFQHIVPCGLPGGQVTSLAQELGRAIPVDEVVPVLARCFGEAFQMETEWAAPEDLAGLAARGGKASHISHSPHAAPQ